MGKGFTTALHSAKNKTQDDQNEAPQDWKVRLLETYIQNQHSLHSALRRSLPGNLPHKTQSENHSEGRQNVYPSNTMYFKNKVYTELATWANLYCREVL